MANILTESESLLLLDFDAEIPCEIAPGCRSTWCSTEEDHPATHVLLAQCGCVHFYCDTGWMVWVKNPAVMCTPCKRCCGMVSVLPIR